MREGWGVSTGRIRRGWKGEMELIMEVSLHTRLPQRKHFNSRSESFTSEFKGTTLVSWTVCTQNKLLTAFTQIHIIFLHVILGCNWSIFPLCIFRCHHKQLADVMQRTVHCSLRISSADTYLYCNAELTPHIHTLHRERQLSSDKYRQQGLNV